MSGAEEVDKPLFPEWERESEVREVEATRETMAKEFARFMRDMMNGRTRGLLNPSQAARAMGVTETYVRQLMAEGKLRASHYPLLRIRGVWGVDVKQWIDSRKEKHKQQENQEGKL